MRIAYFQFGKTNPYQQKYFQSIRDAGGEVTALPFSSVLSAKMFASFDILHLDWLHPFYKSRRGKLVRWAKIQHGLYILEKVRKTGPTKIVHTVHNLLSHDSFLSEAAEQKVIQQLLEKVDSFAVFSDPVFERLRSQFTIRDDQAHFVTPHGHFVDTYDLPIDRNECRVSLGLPTDSMIALFFGSLRENKGVLDLIDVFPQIHDETGANLVIAGDEASPRVAEALNATHPSITVFANGVADADVGRFFAAADFAVMPFRSVLNSSTAILAASMGKYAVFPRISSVYANLDQRAIKTYTACDKHALTDAMLHAFSIPMEERDQLGTAAREFVLENLGWDRTGEAAMQMYRETMGVS